MMKKDQNSHLTAIMLLIMTLLVIFPSCKDKKASSRDKVRSGVVKLYKMQMDEALADFESAAGLDPENQEAWFYIGTVYQNRQDYQTAIDYFTKAITIREDYADAYYNRGLCWFYLGDRNKSCEDWFKAEDYGRVNINDRTEKCR
ncbi:MAG TPA: tetratricopeptide repeat protein [Bacteroidales bacterium]|nr:tetratricopeptide repeat protein [Bacteroidales bacterium]